MIMIFENCPKLDFTPENVKDKEGENVWLFVGVLVDLEHLAVHPEVEAVLGVADEAEELEEAAPLEVLARLVALLEDVDHRLGEEPGCDEEELGEVQNPESEEEEV